MLQSGAANHLKPTGTAKLLPSCLTSIFGAKLMLHYSSVSELGDESHHEDVQDERVVGTVGKLGCV